MVLTKKLVLVLVYFLPVEVINHEFALLLFAYASVLSHVSGVAVTETLSDLHDNETEFITHDNYTFVDVNNVSNAVLWSCREGAKAKSFYEHIYLAMLVLVIILSILLIPINFCRPEFLCKRKVLILKAVIGETSLGIAILFLFLSFNIYPLLCITNHFRLTYNIINRGVDFIIKKRVLGFHLAAPIISVILFSTWLLTNVICFIIDKKNVKVDHWIEMFKDKNYDSDIPTEKEEQERYYEINRVI